MVKILTHTPPVRRRFNAVTTLLSSKQRCINAVTRSYAYWAQTNFLLFLISITYLLVITDQRYCTLALLLLKKHNATVASDVTRHSEKIKLSIFCDSLIFCYCCNKPDFACLFLLFGSGIYLLPVK